MADDLDARVLKAVGEARGALDGLMRDIDPLVKRLNRGEVEPAKAEAAMKKVLAVMGKLAPVAKLQHGPAFDRMGPQAQAELVWLDGLLAELLKLAGRLQGAKRLSGLDPARKGPELAGASKKLMTEAGPSFKGAGQLLKMVEQGVKAGTPEGKTIAYLPMALLLLMIYFTISRGLAAFKARAARKK